MISSEYPKIKHIYDLGERFSVLEIYKDNEALYIDTLVSNWGIALLILGAPVFYLIGIFQGGHKETIQAFKDVIFQKRLGKFTRDVVYARDKKSKELHDFFNSHKPKEEKL